MTDIPRNPEFYYPSRHARIRKKEREIPWQKVTKTLKHGNVKNANGEHCKMFVCHFEKDEYPVAVVANVDIGEIVTVEWRK